MLTGNNVFIGTVRLFETLIYLLEAVLSLETVHLKEIRNAFIKEDCVCIYRMQL